MLKDTAPPMENEELIAKFTESRKKRDKILKERMSIEAALNQAKINMQKLEEEAKETQAGSVKNIPAFLEEAVPENERLMKEFINNVDAAEQILKEHQIFLND